MEYEILNEILTSTVGSLFLGVKKGVEEEMRQSFSSLPPANPSDWVKVEGKARLEASMRRLKLDNNSVHGRELLAKSLEELQQEKRKVKNELKMYDSSFRGVFGREPKREEKEPMRPLYMYYKKLKQAITKKSTEKKPQSLSNEDVNFKLNQLRQERTELRQLLHNYQMEFSKTNHRKIRYHRDIQPVEREYRRYKEVKAEITRLENMLR